MRSKALQTILDQTPKEVEIFIDKYTDLVILINSILKEKGLTQKALAEKLEKSPSEIHKWLSGEHNFTLRSIAKLEAELGETLLEIPVKKSMAVQYSNFKSKGYSVTVNRDFLQKKTEVKEWRYANKQNDYANVG